MTLPGSRSARSVSFGPILDVSMKVEPIPEWQGAFAMPADEDNLRRLINHKHDRGLSGAGILGDQIVLRFEGSGANADQIRPRLKSLGYDRDIDGCVHVTQRFKVSYPGSAGGGKDREKPHCLVTRLLWIGWVGCVTLLTKRMRPPRVSCGHTARTSVKPAVSSTLVPFSTDSCAIESDLRPQGII